MNVPVNFIAVLAAAVAAMVVGFIWYSPILFAKPWMKLMGYTPESMKDAKKAMGKMYALSFVATIVMAFVLYHIMTLSLNFYGYGQIMTGITTAFWVWLGFVAPVQVTDVLFAGRPWKLFAINTGYQLVSLVAMGIVIGMF